MSAKQVGILALQGAFESHRKKITELGGSALLVKTARELEAVSGLILPGGESSTMLRLISPDLQEALDSFFLSGAPVLATCAGTILLAKQVMKPKQRSFGVLDIDVIRNGYGRQIDSFVNPTIALSKEGERLLAQPSLEGVFIRAPVVSRVGAGVQVLASEREHPVLVRSNNYLASTFHPELSGGESPLHSFFLSLL